MNTPAIKTHPYTSELSEALAELVACKEIKDEMDRLDTKHGEGLPLPEDFRVFVALKTDYDKRKPAAWEKAREALKSMGWHRAEDAHPTEKRPIVMILDNGVMKCGTYDEFFGTPGADDGYTEICIDRRNLKTKDWVPNVIAWSYLQLPVW